MKAQFAVENVITLANGKVIAAGQLTRGENLSASMAGRSEIGDLEVEIVSVALINSPPAAPHQKAVHLRIVRGAIESLKGAVLNFD